MSGMIWTSQIARIDADGRKSMFTFSSDPSPRMPGNNVSLSWRAPKTLSPVTPLECSAKPRSPSSFPGHPVRHLFVCTHPELALPATLTLTLTPSLALNLTLAHTMTLTLTPLTLTLNLILTLTLTLTRDIYHSEAKC